MNKNITAHSKGIYLAIATSVISGISIFINKFAVGSITPPLFFTAVKNTGVAILILGILFAFGKWRQLKNLSRKDLGLLVLIGLIGGSLPFYLYFTALSQIPAINAAIIHKTLVIWVAFLAVPFLKEKVTTLQGIAVLILFGSNFIVGGFKGFAFSGGELLALAATVLWAVENVLAKKVLPRVDADIVTAFRMVLGAAVLMSAVVITSPETLTGGLSITSTQWLWLGLTVLTLLGYVTSWYRALKFAPAVTVTTILVSSTLVTNILSAVFITHSWNALETFQAGFVLLGLALFIVSRPKSVVSLEQTF